VSRPTNQELCAEFRHLLTEGARARFTGVRVDAYAPDLLGLTKDWRSDLWRKFNELEDRLCPTPENCRRSISQSKS
jgi:hypothetical protein